MNIASVMTENGYSVRKILSLFREACPEQKKKIKTVTARFFLR